MEPLFRAGLESANQSRSGFADFVYEDRVKIILMRNAQPTNQSKVRAPHWILLGIISLSWLVHLWGIQRNLPYIPEMDEAIYVRRAVYMAASGDLNPHWFGNPGSTIFYPLTVIYHTWHAVTQHGMFFRPDPNLQIRFDAGFWAFYLLGRLLSVAYAVLSIPLIYLIGRRACGRRVALVGTWLAVFYPIAVAHAQVVRTDSVAVFFGMLSLWLCLKLYSRPTERNQLLAGAAIGLSIASRYFMVVLVPVLLIIDGIIVWRRTLAVSRTRAWLSIMIGLLSILGGFALSTPYFFLDFSQAWESIRFEARNSHLGADGLSPIGNFFWYLTVAIPQNITWSQTILAVIGVFLIIARGRFEQRLLVGFVGIFIVGISASPLHWLRWIIQILPLLALFIAYALATTIDYIAQLLKLTGPTQYKLVLLSLLLVSVWPAYQVASFGIQQTNPSTRIQAREWLLDNLPPKSRIFQEAYAAPLANAGFEVSEEFSLAADRTIDDFCLRGEQYLVISSYIYERYWQEPNRYAAERGFYQTLFDKGYLLQEFEPSNVHGGPVIRIYDLQELCNRPE